MWGPGGDDAVYPPPLPLPVQLFHRTAKIKAYNKRILIGPDGGVSTTTFLLPLSLPLPVLGFLTRPYSACQSRIRAVAPVLMTGGYLYHLISPYPPHCPALSGLIL